MKMSKITNRKAWTDEDNAALVALYNRMYAMQESGEKYSKAPLVRALAADLERSKGSIECKLMNVSAVRVNVLGLGFVQGYKPLNNYNGDLVEAVKQVQP